MIRDGLLKISTEYVSAKQENLAGHELAKFIRKVFPKIIKDSLIDVGITEHIITCGTRFVGNWAYIPWIAVLDDRITKSTQRGLYVVFLFSEDMTRIYLTLAVGVHKSSPTQISALVSNTQKNFSSPKDFSLGPLSPGKLTTHSVSKNYELAVIFYKEYHSNALPDDDVLNKDLIAALGLLNEIATTRSGDKMDFTIQGTKCSFSPSDVREAFALTKKEDWIDKPGIAPYWYMIVDNEKKPVKAVFFNMKGAPPNRAFTTHDAARVFKSLGFDVIDTSGQEDKRQISLIGTWRDASNNIKNVEVFISTHGGWASWWSFTIKTEIIDRLDSPFYIYLNEGGGQFNFRIRVEDFTTQQGNEGMTSPWPEFTEEDYKFKKKLSDRQSEIFKTWLKVTAVEKLDHPLTLNDFVPAEPWSNKGNILNQNAFGYVYLKEEMPSKNPVMPYSMNAALEDLFIDQEQLAQIITLIKTKKNLILQGPPGVGKTFFAKRIAYTLLKEKDESRTLMIQFHQSYSYEDFIQGYRPTSEGTFALKNGLFYEFCKRAQEDPEHDYVFIIDEINRGNLSKVFGEVMMLIEADKRGEEYAVPLTYTETLDDKFHIPKNIFLLGLMNTADRSLAMVDYALRRRFAFMDLKPAFDHDSFRNNLVKHGASTKLIEQIITRMDELNRKIVEDKDLGSGFCIGHSFFCPASDSNSIDKKWYEDIIRFEISPLISEYWFEKKQQPKKLTEIIDQLLKEI